MIIEKILKFEKSRKEKEKRSRVAPKYKSMKKISGTNYSKERRVAILISNKVDFSTKKMMRDTVGILT